MQRIFNSLFENLTAGKNAVLATITSSYGSAPRRQGARMLFCENEKPVGTIGGGMIDYKAQQIAELVLIEGKSRIEKFNLAPGKAADLGMICGGGVEVFFQFISHDDRNRINFIEGLTQAFDQVKNYWLLTELCDKGRWEISEEKPHIPENGQNRFFVERLVSDGFVYIFGGGHVAQKLSPVLRHVGFRHIVADDRPEFLGEELFPYADKTIQTDLSDISRNIFLKPSDYAVIMTRGHQYDLAVLSKVLETEAVYVGMIGSRSKIAITFKKLGEIGFGPSDTGRVHTPIGLDILAETPEEISVSIAAELIKVRAGLRQ